MSDGFQFLDIILLAMVAGFIALRLRSVLGRRTGNEPTPGSDSGGGRVAGRSDYEGAVGAEEDEAPSETVVRLEADPELRRAFREIHRADPDFDVDIFVEGARAVYPMVLEAFWRGDRDGLHTFLSDDVYNQFVAAIDQREAAGHEVEARLIDLTDMRIEDAALNGRTAEITVRYTAEIVSVTRDAEGNVVDGNVSDAVTVTDIWTFDRSVDSDDPNWTLVATRSG